MNSPHAAVLLSTFNGAHYLAELLESLVRQTFDDFVLIARDDGSTDDTLAILRSFKGRLLIREIEFENNLGAAHSFMHLMSECGGDYACYLFADQDDYWYPNKVALAVAALRAFRDSPALYFSRLEVVSDKLEHIKYSTVPRLKTFDNVLVENVATGCTVALNTAARELIIKPTPTMIIMHDWWCHLVISALGTIIYDATLTLKYRQHGANVIGASKGFLDETARRVRRFLSRRTTGVFGVSDQAAELLRCYRTDLSVTQTKSIEALLRGKFSLRHRLLLACNNRLVRQRRVDTIILRALFLLGRY